MKIILLNLAYDLLICGAVLIGIFLGAVGAAFYFSMFNNYAP
jgi:hypothetical protein